MTMPSPVLPPLPTSVVGSYSMPEWLQRAKNDYLQRRVSRHDLDEMYDAVRKSAIKDQEVAGVDIISDGELQRDNMIDYFAERLPGVQIDSGSKRFYYDYYDSAVRSKLATGSLGLVGQLSVPVSNDPGGEGPGDLTRVRPARRRGPAAVRPVQGAFHRRARRH